MSDTAVQAPPKLSMGELKSLVESGELSKGTQLFDAKGLAHLSRFANKLFADAAGSGASPYKVQIVFDDKVKGRCSCMAARSRPFCKHAAALLVAWSRAPDGFAVADTAPAGAGGEAKKKAVKTSKVDAQALMKNGVEQVATLVRELALSGVASLGSARAEQIQALGASLRESRLRRLSTRVIGMSEMVGVAASGSDTFDDAEYAELFTDMVLTVRKLEKHLAGEALDDKYVEELIGRTWTKKDRAPVQDLQLVEYSFASRVTPDDFVIRESRFLDLASGQHYSEKQILPGFLAKRSTPKKSHAGWLLEGASGSQYPSFAPHRLDLESAGQQQPLAGESDATLRRLLDACLPDVTGALTAFQERKKDVFAPDTLPVAVRVGTVLAEGARMQVVDAQDGALFLPDDEALGEALATALRGATLEAMLGDIALDGALPTVVPQAVVVRKNGQLELKPLGALDVAQVIASKKVRAQAAKAKKLGAQRASWADTARAVGVSAAAIALGEVRDELAHALVAGLGSVVPRFTEPLAARLAELGLAKQGELLTAAAQKSDPADRLDDVVKLYQVLGIALTRLSGATHVDKSSLVEVPTFESVKVRRTDERLEPREVANRVAAGALNRYQAAVRYAAYYDAVPPETLAEKIYPTWADGSAQPYVVRVFASRPEVALQAAERALGGTVEDARAWWLRSNARMARLTALKVLEAIGTREAARLLTKFMTGGRDNTLKALAKRALRSVQQKLGQNAAPLDEKDLKRLDELVSQLLNASDRGDRERAAWALGQEGFVEAIPWLRASFQGDVSSGPREAAAHALGLLGDTEALDGFVRMLKQRNEDGEAAKLAAYALGNLGDVRGIDALLDAWAEGWQPGILSDMIKQIGVAALEPMLDRVEAQPELVKRKASINVVASLDPAEVSQCLVERAEAAAHDDRFVEKASVWMTLAAVTADKALGRALVKSAGRGPAETALAKKLLELRPAIAEKTASKEEKALYKKVKAALE